MTMNYEPWKSLDYVLCSNAHDYDDLTECYCGKYFHYKYVGVNSDTNLNIPLDCADKNCLKCISSYKNLTNELNKTMILTKKIIKKNYL